MNPRVNADDPLLTIGAFARKSWLSPKALRLYERVGLLKPARVEDSNSYRWYRQSQLASARLIAMLRRLDMPLAVIADVLSAVADGRPEMTTRWRPDGVPQPVSDPMPGVSKRAAALVAEYWESVEHRIAVQRELAAHLQIRLHGEDEQSYLSIFNVQERDVPEQVVLTDQRHLYVQDLPNWLPITIERLCMTAAGHGGVVAPVFVVYHGQVNQDSDGPVEVCVPIESELDGLRTRREPMHREAYVRLTKAQVAYPQILSAYDAVAQWMRENDRTMAAPPREVYFTDFLGAQPTDQVCDVAYPLSIGASG